MLMYFLFGGCLISMSIHDKEKFLNICMRNRLVYRNFTFSNDMEKISFTCTFYTAFLLKELLKGEDIDWKCEKYFGLPYLLFKYRKRYGILIGLLLASALIILSGSFVWDVRVSGNNSLEKQEVIDFLDAQGLKVGNYIKNLDVDVIENRVLISSDKISWISINLVGNVAFVEIRESQHPPIRPQQEYPANLIAYCDGQIESIETHAGETKVTVGQFVRKGDLLISGIYDSYPWGYRYVRAQGNVMARTIKNINIEIPLNYQKKAYTGEINTKNSLIFFSKEIKLYRKTRFLGTTYDTIYKVSKCCLPHGIDLPLEWHSTIFAEYIYEDQIRTPEEALELAYEELDKQIDDMVSSGAVILRKNTSGELQESRYLLECTIVVIENIAETKEFEVIE